MLENALQDFEKAQGITFHNAPVLLAVSGGVDSMVLAHVFLNQGIAFGLAHVNFGLRGEESDGDEAFVRDFAASNQIPIHVFHAETQEYALEKQISIQMAARELRYDFFEKTCREQGYAYSATAHQADDNLENFFIYLLRNRINTAFKGIAPLNGTYIRPLLPYSREEILSFAEKNNIKWREDSSNAKTHYLRNKIRHMIVPGMKEFFPEVMEEFTELASLWRAQVARKTAQWQHFLMDHAAQQNSKTRYPKSFFGTQPGSHALQFRLETLGFTQDQISKIFHSETGAAFFSQNHCLTAERDHWVLQDGAGEAPNFEVVIKEKEVGRLLEAGGFLIASAWAETPIEDFDLDTWYFDAEQLEFPLTLRNWQHGDKLHPLGMTGNKKVSDVLTDAHIGGSEKGNYPILLSGKNILGVVNLRRSALAMVSEDSKKVLKLWMEKTETMQQE